MSSRRGRPRKKTIPPQADTVDQPQVTQEFVANQTQEHGRGQRPPKENDLIASYKAVLKKNAATAKKAQATRKANKSAHQAPSTLDHDTTTQTQVQLPAPSHALASCSPMSAAQTPQVPLRMPHVMQTPTHLLPLSAPVFQTPLGQVTQTPRQQPFPDIHVASISRQHQHPGAPSSQSAPEPSFMDQLNSPHLMPFPNEFSGQQNLEPREVPPTPQTPFHPHSFHIPAGQPRPFRDLDIPMHGAREVPSTPRTPFQPPSFPTPTMTGQSQPLRDLDINQSHHQLLHDKDPSRSPTSEHGLDEDDCFYEEPPWSQHHLDQDDEGAVSAPEREDAGDLNLIMRPVQLKRKVRLTTRARKMAKTSTLRHASHVSDEESNSGSGSDKDGSDHDQPSRPSRGVQHLSRTSKTILNVAYEILKRDLTVVDPFPDKDENEGLISKAISKQMQMAMDAWYEACGELDESRDPKMFELDRIKDRVSQFRGQLRDLARPLTADAFGFTDVKTLDNPTPENIERVVAENRNIYATVKDKFWYTDPTNTSLKDSMYRNLIIQKLLNVNWFGEGTYQRAAYFDNKTKLPMVTLALELTTISCTIDEWATGRRKLVKFEAKTFSARFQRHLKRLMDWKTFTATQSHDLATRLQETLLRNARASASDEHGVENGEEEDEESTMALFAANQV